MHRHWLSCPALDHLPAQQHAAVATWNAAMRKPAAGAAGEGLHAPREAAGRPAMKRMQGTRAHKCQQNHGCSEGWHCTVVHTAGSSNSLPACLTVVPVNTHMLHYPKKHVTNRHHSHRNSGDSPAWPASLPAPVQPSQPASPLRLLLPVLAAAGPTAATAAGCAQAPSAQATVHSPRCRHRNPVG